MSVANPARGEVVLVLGDDRVRLRPSFAALVAAEAELGPLFALVERAAAGGLTLAEMAGLLWHCLDAPAGLTRADFGDRLVAGGLAAVTPALRVLLGQVLAGR
ncbi:MAG: GTA-gp10 family protein [Polymorphobacter sp.]